MNEEKEIAVIVQNEHQFNSVICEMDKQGFIAYSKSERDYTKTAHYLRFCNNWSWQSDVWTKRHYSEILTFEQWSDRFLTPTI